MNVYVQIGSTRLNIGGFQVQWLGNGRVRNIYLNGGTIGSVIHIERKIEAALAPGDVFVYWHFYLHGRPPTEAVDIGLSASFQMQYRNPLLGSRAIPNTYQSVTGYVDRQGNYTDGGPVRAEGMRLISPIDVVIALLRDKNIGLGAKSQNVSTDNVAAIRNRLGAARIDGQIGISRTQSFSEWQKLLRAFGILLQKSGDEYRFTDNEVPTSTILTDHDIIDISTDKSPLSEIYTEFVLNYHYSHATGQYTKRLVADSHHIGVADGRTTGNTVILSGGGISDILPGHRVHIEGVGISETRDVERVNGSTVHIAGNNLPDVDPVRVWVGPYFDYRCYLSSEKYGEQRQKTIEIDFVADDATARQILEREITYNTTAKYRTKLRCPIGAARIKQGTRICIDHRDLPVPLRASLVAHYPSGLPYAQTDIATGLTPLPTETSGILFARHSSATETLRVGVARGRGLIETLRQNWPSGTEVYHQPHIWQVLRWQVDPNQDAVTLHTEILEKL